MDEFLYLLFSAFAFGGQKSDEAKFAGVESGGAKGGYGGAGPRNWANGYLLFVGEIN